jgi:hypothetical protein
MLNAAPTIQGRMLCASVLAYSVPDTGGTINPPNSNIPQTAPYYAGAGYLAPPTMIASDYEDTNAACTVGLTQDGIVLAFRGTVYNSITDWINDLLLEPVTVPGIPGKVHDGFNKALGAIFVPTITIILQLQKANPQAALYITGHSKGAGMAPLAAAYLAANHVKATAVYLYAPPLPGNSVFAAAYNKAFPNTYLYENNLDMVPLLPPSPTTAGGLDAYFIQNGSKEALAAAALITYAGLEYDYSAVGSTNNSFFIPAPQNGKYTVVTLTNSVYLQQLQAVGTALVNNNFSAIAAAHNSRCGYGYMSALGGGIC